LFDVENVYKKYKRTVLSGVSLNAEPGEIIGVAGENGSGKSTLLSIMTSVIKPDSGKVSVEGEDVFKNRKTLRRKVGFVPQENSLFGNLTARDNLKFWASAYGCDWKNALNYLSADDLFLKTKVEKLSGGMRKRLSIAVSLAHDPLYLVMDEPTAGLDIGFKQSFVETALELKKRGRGVIFTSHQPDELLACDRIYVLKGGTFVYEGPPDKLASDGDFVSALYSLIKGRPRHIENGTPFE